MQRLQIHSSLVGAGKERKKACCVRENLSQVKFCDNESPGTASFYSALPNISQCVILRPNISETLSVHWALWPCISLRLMSMTVSLPNVVRAIGKLTGIL